MTADRTFAPWVEPIAREMRESRAEILEVARAVSSEVWGQSSPNEGWTYKDLLAHLESSDLRLVLQPVVAGEAVNASVLALGDADSANARLLEERRQRSSDQLIGELETQGKETLDLLARLTEADEGRRQDDIPFSFTDGLRIFLQHDRLHLEQLRTALEERQ